jgi:hypothetical protein
MTAKITRADEARWRTHEIDHGLCVCDILDALDAARQMAVALEESLLEMGACDCSLGDDDLRIKHRRIDQSRVALAAFAALVDLED